MLVDAEAGSVVAPSVSPPRTPSFDLILLLNFARVEGPVLFLAVPELRLTNGGGAVGASLRLRSSTMVPVDLIDVLNGVLCRCRPLSIMRVTADIRLG